MRFYRLLAFVCALLVYAFAPDAKAQTAVRPADVVLERYMCSGTEVCAAMQNQQELINADRARLQALADQLQRLEQGRRVARRASSAAHGRRRPPVVPRWRVALRAVRADVNGLRTDVQGYAASLARTLTRITELMPMQTLCYMQRSSGQPNVALPGGMTCPMVAHEVEVALRTAATYFTMAQPQPAPAPAH